MHPVAAEHEHLRDVPGKDLLHLGTVEVVHELVLSLPWLTGSWIYHLEHHLFPAVPTCKLSTLARRLDRVAPELAARRVF